MKLLNYFMPAFLLLMKIYNFMKTLQTICESKTTQTNPCSLLSSHYSRSTCSFLPLLSSRAYLLSNLPCISSSELIKLVCNCLYLLRAPVI